MNRGGGIHNIVETRTQVTKGIFSTEKIWPDDFISLITPTLGEIANFPPCILQSHW